MPTLLLLRRGGTCIQEENLNNHFRDDQFACDCSTTYYSHNIRIEFVGLTCEIPLLETDYCDNDILFLRFVNNGRNLSFTDPARFCQATL